MVVLETVAALAFVYALLSVVASAFKELLEAAVQRRKRDLKGALEDLLSPQGARQLIEHGLVNAVQHTPSGSTPSDGYRRWPSYIEPATFAKVAVQMHQARLLVDCKLTRALEGCSGDAAALALQIEQLYTQRMERLGGSFKRNAQWWLLGLGVVCAVVMDADTVRLAQTLGQDATRRAMVVAMSQDTATLAGLKSSCASAMALPEGQQLPPQQLIACVDTAVPGVLGWNGAEVQRLRDLQGLWFVAGLLLKVLGYLLTGAAVSMGAPFWFDLLNKVSNLRSTLKPLAMPPAEAAAAPPVTNIAVSAGAVSSGSDSSGADATGADVGLTINPADAPAPAQDR